MQQRSPVRHCTDTKFTHRAPKEMKSSPVTQLKVRQGNTSANALKNISSHSWVAQQGRDR